MPARPLIIRLRNWVGDVVLGLPLLQRLERAGYLLQLLGKGWARDLLAGHGWSFETLADHARGRIAQLRHLHAQAQAMDPGFERRLNALALPYSFSSAFEMRLAGLQAVGYRHEGRGWLLRRAVPRSSSRHEMAIYWDLGSALLAQPEPPPSRLNLRLAPHHEAQAAELRSRLGLHPGYIVLCPFAAGTFAKQDKSWPLFPQWAELALPSLGRDLLVCPGPGDEERLADRDYRACRVARGVGLGTYAALLRGAALVIANDTGPGHLAAAVGAPLISVLGPTDPTRWGAVGPTVHIVQHEQGWPSVDEVLAFAQSHLLAG